MILILCLVSRYGSTVGLSALGRGLDAFEQDNRASLSARCMSVALSLCIDPISGATAKNWFIHTPVVSTMPGAYR